MTGTEVIVFLAVIVILVAIAAITGAFDFRHAKPPAEMPAEQQRPEVYATTKNVRIDYRTAHGKVWRDR